MTDILILKTVRTMVLLCPSLSLVSTCADNIIGEAMPSKECKCYPVLEDCTIFGMYYFDNICRSKFYMKEKM